MSWAAIGRPMLPTPMNAIRIAVVPGVCSEIVEPEDVVPEDLLLARVRERQLEETIHRVRVLGVPVRVVRSGDEIVVTDRVDDVRDELLVTLDRAEALPPEVLRGRHREMRHLAVGPAPLVVL